MLGHVSSSKLKLGSGFLFFPLRTSSPSSIRASITSKINVALEINSVKRYNLLSRGSKFHTFSLVVGVRPL